MHQQTLETEHEEEHINKLNKQKKFVRSRKHLNKKQFFFCYRCGSDNPVGNYMFKINNRHTRTRCEVCSKLTIKAPERRQWLLSGIFIVNFTIVILHLDC